MSHIQQALHTILLSVFEQRQDVLLLAAKERSKFERWLQFELAVALERDPHFANVSVESTYPHSNKIRSDLSFQTEGTLYFVELKTANTNWQVTGIPFKNKPITDNVNGIIKDIHKLREHCEQAYGFTIFVFCPMPKEKWKERRELIKHLQKIEREGKLPANSLESEAVYTPLTTDYGVLSFVVAVV